MREYKFRGKRLDDGEWVYSEMYKKNGEEVQFGKYEECSMQNCDCGLWDDYWYLVDPATVGQYTGLKDKNGKEIYERDILRGYAYPFESDGEFNYYAEVVWFDNSPAFGLYTHKNPKSKVRGASHGNSDYMEEFQSDLWEVIGNIHDNPELLEG